MATSAQPHLPEARSPKPGADASSDRLFYLLNATISSAAIALLFWLLVVRKPVPGQSPLLDFLPLLNALLNSTSALLLLLGRAAIRRGDRRRHAQLMLAAFGTSAVFLVSYLGYHFVHGDTRYLGAPALRAVYLLILASHVLLSIAVVPLVLAALWFAWRAQFVKHTRVTRWLHPIWLYVSVTGVLVYLMLYRLPHGSA
jgi:putative membrane protein